MNYLELSIKDVEEESKKLANKIKNNDTNVEIVIFIAKGSFQIGKVISEQLKCPLLEIRAKRKGNKLKEILKPILKIIPRRIKEQLRKKEFNSNYHENNKDRIITFDEREWEKYKNVKNIIIVDDSVDTGNSMIQVKEKVQEYFKEAKIEIAALNYFEKSKKIINTDYYIYKDYMLNGPWSNDSKYNKEFMKMYSEYKVEKNNER